MLTYRKTAVVIVCICIICTLSGTPVYVVNKLEWEFSTLRNATLLGLVFRDDKEVVEKFTFLINNFFIPFGSFIIIAVCTAILSTQLRKKSEWRKTTITSAQADRISTRNLKIAKMIMSISTLFIICFVPTTMLMLAIAFDSTLQVKGTNVNVSIIIGQFSYVLEGINSSMNIFIYIHMSSKYRHTFINLGIRKKEIGLLNTS